MDSMPSVLPVSQAEAAREASRRQAIFSGGHKFIWLTLKNTKYRTISGINIVHATPYLDEMAGGVTRYHLEVRGGHTDFQFDSGRGVFRYAMLDCDHNRKFLASHFHLEFWDIDDESVRDDIEERSEAIKKSVRQDADEDDPEEPAGKDSEDQDKPSRRRGRAAKRRHQASTVRSDAPASIPVIPGIQSDMVTPTATRVLAP